MRLHRPSPRVLAALLACFAACGGLHASAPPGSPIPDAGPLGLSGLDAGADARDGGPELLDAGQRGHFQFGRVTLPAGLKGDAINALSGNSRAVYALTSAGEVLRNTDGGGFELWGVIPQRAEDGGVAHEEFTFIYASEDAGIYATSTHALFACAPDCENPAGFKQRTEYAVALCGHPQHGVWAFTSGSKDVFGELWQYGASDWEKRASPTDAFGVAACWVAPDGQVYGAAFDELERYSHGVVYREEYRVMTVGTVWLDIGGTGKDIWAVGNAGRIAHRNADGSWQDALEPDREHSTFYTFLAVSDSEAFAGGAKGTWAHLKDGVWAYDLYPPNPYGGSLYASHRVNENAVYVGGSLEPKEDAGTAPALFYGTR